MAEFIEAVNGDRYERIFVRDASRPKTQTWANNVFVREDGKVLIPAEGLIDQDESISEVYLAVVAATSGAALLVWCGHAFIDADWVMGQLSSNSEQLLVQRAKQGAIFRSSICNLGGNA